jgi:hypothetical protein
MKAKRSVILLITAILSTAYFIYLIVYFGGAVGGSTGDVQLGAAIATALVMPHMIVVVLGAIFCWLGYFLRKKAFALVGAILFCVALALFFMYFMFTVPLIILGFIAMPIKVSYAKCRSALSKQQKTQNKNYIF